VAVVDTGLDASHPEIAANVWINEGEVPGNQIDDDGNGYAAEPMSSLDARRICLTSSMVSVARGSASGRSDRTRSPHRR